MEDHVRKAAALLGEPQKKTVKPYVLEFLKELEQHGEEGLANLWAQRTADLVAELQAHSTQSAQERAKAHPHVRKVLEAWTSEGVNTAGLRKILRDIEWEDQGIVDALLEGLRLVGELPHTGLWEQVRSKEATLTKPDLIAQAKELKAQLITSEEARSLSAHQRHLRKCIWEQTKEDIRAGIIGKPRKARSELGTRMPLTRRFGREQLTSKGKTKIRCIDDFTASLINLAVGVPEKLHHEHIDDLVDLAEKLGKMGYTIKLLKADFHKAYRSVPIHPEETELADLLVFDMDDLEWVIVRQYALPFGAVAAVYGWERVGAALTGILKKKVGIPFFRYVDDLFTALPEKLAAQARKSLEDIIQACGFALAPGKTEGPSAILTILGILVTIGDNSINLKPDPAKAQKWKGEIDAALKGNELTPGEAQKLAGRLNFATSTLFGKVGKAHLRPIYHRAHAAQRKHHSSRLYPSLKKCLKWWKKLLNLPNLNVDINFEQQARPIKLLYTDATGHGNLGFALYDKHAHNLLWGASSTPQWLRDRLQKRETQVNAHELIAAHWGLAATKTLIPGAIVHLFIDNTAAQSIAQKGTSSKNDLNHIAGSLWLLAASLKIELNIWRVPSKLNASDPPSRGKLPPLASAGNRHTGHQCHINLLW